MNLMTYEFHGVWDTLTGQNAPLYRGNRDVTLTQRQRNVNDSVNYWLSQGAARQKIVLGIPTFGRTYTLRNQSNNGVGAAASRPGQAGLYTKEPGIMGYNEVSSIYFCNLLMCAVRMIFFSVL